MLTVLIYLLKMHMNTYRGITAAVIHGHNIEHNGLHILFTLSTAQKNNR